LGASVASALAAGDEPPPAGDPAAAQGSEYPVAKGLAIIGVCLGAGICAVGGGLAIARIGAKCIEAMARQPEAAGTMFAPMVVAAAMVEGGMLFAIVVCLLGMLLKI
jgi:F-type H+-transporting ATPase subunit c